MQRIHLLKVELMRKSSRLSHLSQRCISSSKREKKPETFADILAERRQQAQRSVLIGYNGSNLPRAVQACQRHGSLKAISLFRRDEKNYALVELDSVPAVESLLDHSIFSREQRHFPLRSRMLSVTGSAPNASRRYRPPINVPMYQEHHITDKQLYQKINSRTDLSSQMKEVYMQLRLGEGPQRLRHVSCQIVEDAVQRLCPTATMTPYGSAVNGFGRYDCDVDMMIDLYGQSSSRQPPSGLRFASKTRMEDQRADTQQTLETFARFLKQFVPHHYHIQWVLRARIPIIKFQQKCTGLDCDMALGNESGVYMSELLHLYGELDHRVRPLVFTIRNWARSQNITLDGLPNQHLSNFMVTLLVLYFLQTRPIPVLPSIKKLEELAVPSDLCKFDGGSCHFVSHWSRVPKSTNQEPLGLLLLEFFAFYHLMDFNAGRVSLVSGQLEPFNSERCPLHLENPLEPQLNAGRNVGEEELKQFQTLCGEAMRVLNGDEQKPRLRYLIDPTLAGTVDTDIQFSVGNILADATDTSMEQDLDTRDTSMEQEFDTRDTSMEQESDSVLHSENNTDRTSDPDLDNTSETSTLDQSGDRVRKNSLKQVDGNR